MHKYMHVALPACVNIGGSGRFVLWGTEKQCLQGSGLGNVFCMLMLGSNATCDHMFSVGTDGGHHPHTIAMVYQGVPLLELLALRQGEERMAIGDLK